MPDTCVALKPLDDLDPDLALLAAGPQGTLAAYGAAVRRDGRHGAGLGRATAIFLAPVLLAGEAPLLTAYRQTVAILLAKGVYLLTAPLEGLRWLLDKADRSAALAYLALLRVVFDRKLSYNRCQYLGHLLPRHLMRMPVSRRCGQLGQLTRIAAVDLRLLEPFRRSTHDARCLATGSAGETRTIHAGDRGMCVSTLRISWIGTRD